MEESGGTLKSHVEKRVVELVARGYPNCEIARELFLTEQTVAEILVAVSEKLGVSDRLELILYAIIHGMLGNHAGVAAGVAPGKPKPAAKEASAA
jgi:DNA-binding NarL/FixJ family response regulator